MSRPVQSVTVPLLLCQNIQWTIENWARTIWSNLEWSNLWTQYFFPYCLNLPKMYLNYKEKSFYITYIILMEAYDNRRCFRVVDLYKNNSLRRIDITNCHCSGKLAWALDTWWLSREKLWKLMWCRCYTYYVNFVSSAVGLRGRNNNGHELVKPEEEPVVYKQSPYTVTSPFVFAERLVR